MNGESSHVGNWNGRGRLDVARMLDTMRDGGLFENIFVRALMTDGANIQCYELFDVGDASRALARFAGLRRADGASP